MSPITIVENEYITIQCFPERKLIYHIIHKPIPDAPLREALNAGTDALKKYGATKWLSDDRKNGPLLPETVEWGLKDWDPRTIAAGWKYWANIIPQELAAAGTLMPLIDILHDMGLKMLLFTDPQKANDWLDSIKS